MPHITIYMHIDFSFHYVVHIYTILSLATKLFLFDYCSYVGQGCLTQSFRIIECSPYAKYPYKRLTIKSLEISRFRNTHTQVVRLEFPNHKFQVSYLCILVHPHDNTYISQFVKRIHAILNLYQAHNSNSIDLLNPRVKQSPISSFKNPQKGSNDLGAH